MGVKLHERTLPSGKKQLFLDVYHKGQRKKETLDLELTGDRKADRLLVGFATLASNYYIGINLSRYCIRNEQ